MKGRLKDFRRPRSLLIYSKMMLCVQGMRTITPLWAGVEGAQNSVPCKILQFDYVSKSAFKINRRLLQFAGDCGGQPAHRCVVCSVEAQTAGCG